MKTIVLLAALAVASSLASAEETILDYHGAVVTGTAYSLMAGDYATVGSAFSGAVTGEIDLTHSGNLYYLNSLDFTLTRDDGTTSPLNGGFLPPIFDYGGGTVLSNGVNSVIDLITLNGPLLGAAVELFQGSPHASTSTLVITPGGDSVKFDYATSNGNCENYLPSDPVHHGPYNGPPINNCHIIASNMTAGTWTATPVYVPEIDPNTSIAAVMLLLGGLVVLRGQSSRPQS